MSSSKYIGILVTIMFSAELLIVSMMGWAHVSMNKEKLSSIKIVDSIQVKCRVPLKCCVPSGSGGFPYIQ